MVGASAATGFRTWLQTRGFTWLTPRRLKSLTVTAMAGATIFSTVSFSGSSAAPAIRASTPPAHVSAASAARAWAPASATNARASATHAATLAAATHGTSKRV
jgi:hypothetical protein